MNKTVHEFECRDDIWKRVEALANRRGVSTDEIVQAALIQLFTRKKAEAEANTPAPGPAPTADRPTSGTPLPRPAGPPGPPGSSGGPPTPPGGRPTLPRPVAPGGGPRLPPPGPGPGPAAAAAPARPVGTPPPGRAPAPSEDRPLYLWFEGNWYTIDQDQFVIGRGSKFSDLPIKDANISRRHCAVVRRAGEYYIKDLGSTNGIEFAGVRVDDHHVEEGNVYYLCDHEIRFSFNAPY
jgi:hypothetical protein